MSKQFTLQDFVKVSSIVLDYFFNNTVIPDDGMTEKEINTRVDFFAEKAYQDEKISLFERDNFLLSSTILQIGIPRKLEPSTDDKPVRHLTCSQS